MFAILMTSLAVTAFSVVDEEELYETTREGQTEETEEFVFLEDGMIDDEFDEEEELDEL